MMLTGTGLQSGGATTQKDIKMLEYLLNKYKLDNYEIFYMIIPEKNYLSFERGFIFIHT